MIKYVYFPPADTLAVRREVDLADSDAERAIGERAMNGFELHNRMFRTPVGKWCSVTYFQSGITGQAWAVYFRA